MGKFQCDMYIWSCAGPHRFAEKYQKAVLAGTVNEDFDSRELEPKLARAKLYATSESLEYLWDYSYGQLERGWTSLTSGASRCYRVDVDHAGMKFDEGIAKEIASLLPRYTK